MGLSRCRCSTQTNCLRIRYFGYHIAKQTGNRKKFPYRYSCRYNTDPLSRTVDRCKTRCASWSGKNIFLRSLQAKNRLFPVSISHKTPHSKSLSINARTQHFRHCLPRRHGTAQFRSCLQKRSRMLTAGISAKTGKTQQQIGYKTNSNKRCITKRPSVPIDRHGRSYFVLLKVPQIDLHIWDGSANV